MLSRSVILRHTLADGSWHRDWLIEPPGATEGGEDIADLVAFRLAPDAPTPEGDRAFECEHLPPHRRRYLRYEGPISGNRGRVVQESALTLRWESLSDAEGTLWTLHPSGDRRWVGRRLADGRWLWTPDPR